MSDPSQREIEQRYQQTMKLHHKNPALGKRIERVFVYNEYGTNTSSFRTYCQQTLVEANDIYAKMLDFTDGVAQSGFRKIDLNNYPLPVSVSRDLSRNLVHWISLVKDFRLLTFEKDLPTSSLVFDSDIVLLQPLSVLLKLVEPLLTEDHPPLFMLNKEYDFPLFRTLTSESPCGNTGAFLFNKASRNWSAFVSDYLALLERAMLVQDSTEKKQLTDNTRILNGVLHQKGYASIAEVGLVGKRINRFFMRDFRVGNPNRLCFVHLEAHRKLPHCIRKYHIRTQRYFPHLLQDSQHNADPIIREFAKAAHDRLIKLRDHLGKISKGYDEEAQGVSSQLV